MSGGAVHDPLAALLLCHVERVAFSVINGRVIVRDKELLTLDVNEHVARHNEIARAMVSRYPVADQFKLV